MTPKEKTPATGPTVRERELLGAVGHGRAYLHYSMDATSLTELGGYVPRTGTPPTARINTVKSHALRAA